MIYDSYREVKVNNTAANAVPVFIAPPPLPETATAFSDYLVVSVAAGATANQDKVVPIGKTATIENFTAILASTDTGNQDILARLIWDPAGANTLVEIGRDVSIGIPVNQSFVGDGTKVMRISITNGSTSALILSARYNGYTKNT